MWILLALASGMSQHDLPAADSVQAFHPPETQATAVFTPRAVDWVEPKPLALPSAEKLKTVEIRGKTYEIKRVATEPKTPEPEKAAEVPDGGVVSNAGRPGVALYQNLNEALYFRSESNSGRKSDERLVVEDCTFILDFEEGDFDKWAPRRSAILVEGYKEVLIRNCVFISKGRGSDPLRKTIASVYASDCLNVQIEDCYFEGRTIGWRGHVIVFGCGPTTIRNCEINGRNDTSGGIWVATGVGEGKIGWPHQDNESLMIYPAGPLLLENCWLHSQRGKENSDGIYVQSIRPYLIRNCLVDGWGPDDSLIDIGFRDTAPKGHNGKVLVNHGGLGIVEHCELSKGWVKASVGLGGGVLFRRNLLKGAYIFPYVFDGGSWYVVGNVWKNMSTLIVSGRNNQLNGWTPKEGMFINGSKMFLFNNRFESPEKTLNALYVAGAKPGPLKDVIVSDYNVYDMPPPKSWGLEPLGFNEPAATPGGDGKKSKDRPEFRYVTLDDWRAATGNDKNSVLGNASRDKFKSAANPVVLPGNIPMEFGEVPAGLTGAVGVQNADVLKRAKAASAEAAAEMNREILRIPISQVTDKGGSAVVTRTDRKYGDRGTHLQIVGEEGAEASLAVTVPTAGHFAVSSRTVKGTNTGTVQLVIAGRTVGDPVGFDPKRDGVVRHGIVELTSGENVLTLRVVSGADFNFDGFVLEDAVNVERENKRLADARAVKDAAAAENARLDALKVKFEIVGLPIEGRIKGHASNSSSKGRDYKLWQAVGTGDTISFAIDLRTEGNFELSLVTTNQADKGTLALLVDGKEIGSGPLGGTVKFGSAKLSEGSHVVTFRLTGPEGAKDVSVRMQRLDLLPITP